MTCADVAFVRLWVVKAQVSSGLLIDTRRLLLGWMNWRAPFAQCEPNVPSSAINKRTILLLGCGRAVRETWLRGTELD